MKISGVYWNLRSFQIFSYRAFMMASFLLLVIVIFYSEVIGFAGTLY